MSQATDNLTAAVDRLTAAVDKLGQLPDVSGIVQAQTDRVTAASGQVENFVAANTPPAPPEPAPEPVA